MRPVRCLLPWLALPWFARPFARAQQRQNQQLLAHHGNRSTDLIALHRDLISIESISGNEGEIGFWLAQWLQHQGYNTELQEVGRDRYNILAWPGNTRETHTLVTSHIDTVPPFIPYAKDTNGSVTHFKGRGSVDAKASVASQIIATNELLNTGKVNGDRISLLFVVGEETGGHGMRLANELLLRPEVVIFGEPTENKLVSGHKGILDFRIHAMGKAAHSGYPWLGRSANEVLITVLAAIKQMEKHLPRSDKYGATTINVGTLSGGVAANVVAESAEAHLMARIATGSPEELREVITKTINKVVRDEFGDDVDQIVAVEFGEGAYGPVDIDHNVPGFETMTVNYGTDVPHFEQTVPGQKRYLYGGGSILVAHSDHEVITLEDLQETVLGYKKLILHSLSDSCSQC